jgi:hypothetical protein
LHEDSVQDAGEDFFALTKSEGNFRIRQFVSSLSLFLRRQIRVVSVFQSPHSRFPEPEGNATHHHQLASRKLASFQVDDADAGLE